MSVMETHEVLVHGRDHQQVPRSTAVEGEEEHHHEKKSVLKKVKDKARKIKDEQKGNRGWYSETKTLSRIRKFTELPCMRRHGIGGFFVEDAIPGQRRANVGNLPRTEVGTQSDGLKFVAGDADSGGFIKLEKDPHAPREPGESYSPGNYESKVMDPTHSGGAEADVDLIIRDFKSMNVSDEPNHGPTRFHNQFSRDEPAAKGPIDRENHESIPSQQHQPTTYASKITSAASALAGTGVSAKDAVALKLGYGGTKTETDESAEGGDQKFNILIEI